ncbi:MAG: MFS transporter [Gammaproteobacteria bacterium]|nr:MFS transporter [Gammaproteobacteria bacterium]
MSTPIADSREPASISIVPILSVNFVGTLGFSIVLPFMVFLVTKWGGNAIVYGVLASTYSFFQLLGAPLLGKWSDRYGRRKILLLSQLGTLLSWLIFLTAFVLPTDALLEIDSSTLGQFTLTLPLLVLFAARATDGLTGGNVSVANAYLADITDDAHRSENYGRMAVSTNVGFIAGPALAGLLGATVHGEILPVATALLVSFVATLLIGFGLRESRPVALATDPQTPNACKVFGQETKECFVRHCEALSNRDILRLPQIPALLGINFLVMLGFSVFYIAFPTHAATRLDWQVTDTGAYFATLSLFMVVVQGPLLSRLSKKLSDTVLIVGGSLALGAGFAFLLSDDTTMIYAAALLIALGNGLMWPTFMAVLSRRAEGRVQGAVQGFASSLGAAASIVGLISGGLLYTWMGAWVFAVPAAITVCVALLAFATAAPQPAD